MNTFIKNNPSLENRSARYEYRILEEIECGVQLRGNEVKSIRDGKASIKEAWCKIEDGKLLLKQMHIAKWKSSNTFDIDEDRDKILLAHKSEIRRLEQQTRERGITIIPLRVYFNSQGRCKVVVALCKGNTKYDKRMQLKEKQIKIEAERELKEL